MWKVQLTNIFRDLRKVMLGKGGLGFKMEFLKARTKHGKISHYFIGHYIWKNLMLSYRGLKNTPIAIS